MSSEMEVNNEFAGETGQSDLTLVVEDHRIPVSKSVLCIASPVFRAMLEGDFQEKSKSEITLPGKSYEAIVVFLRCIYPDKMKKVKDKNVYKLLPLAHEYGVKTMEKRCEKVLIQMVRKTHMNNVVELYRHIQMSETYGLEDMKTVCIYLASEHNLAQFKAARQTYQISDDSHCRIVELTLRRRELDLADDRYLSVHATTGKEETLLNRRYNICSVVNFTLTGKIVVDETDVTKYLRALRLSERFRITTSETDVRKKMIGKLQHFRSKIKEKSPKMEEFDLLPESIKVAVQNT